MTEIASIQNLPAKGVYAAAWKRLKALPQDALVSLNRLDGSIPALMARAQFRKALDHRINSRAGNEAANNPIDIELIRDARSLDDILQRRIRVYQFGTPMMIERFGHLLSNHND